MCGWEKIKGHKACFGMSCLCKGTYPYGNRIFHRVSKHCWYYILLWWYYCEFFWVFSVKHDFKTSWHVVQERCLKNDLIWKNQSWFLKCFVVDIQHSSSSTLFYGVSCHLVSVGTRCYKFILQTYYKPHFIQTICALLDKH